MAIRISSDASCPKRSASSPTQTAYTLAGWFYFNSVTPARFWGTHAIYAGADGVPTSGQQFHSISSVASGSAALELLYFTSGAVSTGIALATTRVNTWHFIAMTGASTAAGGIVAYIRQAHEKAFTKAVSTGTAMTFTAARFEYGRDAFTGEFMDGAAQHCIAFNRALDETELMKLSYALLAEAPLPDRRNLNVCYRLHGADDIQDLSGNARAFTATVGANAQGLRLWQQRPSVFNAASGSISGTSTLTFSPSGVLTGDGALTGSTTLSFAPTATLTGTAPISGSSTLTFSPTATLSGTGALAGSSTLTFSPTSSLTGSGALSGTATITFSPTGVLADAGSGSLAGSSSFTFTVVGTLTGTGDLAGSTTLTFSPAGNLTNATPVVSDQPSGGFFYDFDRYRAQKQRRKKREEDELAEIKAIDEPTTREIAQLLRVQEARDAERADLDRLQSLADQYAGTAQGLPRPITATLLKAYEERSRNALEQLQREMSQLADEEDVSIMLILNS